MSAAVHQLFRDSDTKRGPVPADVVSFWRRKALKVSFAYQDVWKEEHSYAFTAAKVMRTDVLEALQDELDSALTQGTPFPTFKKAIEPRMRELGWWVEHEVIDPKTGEVAKVNPPRRLRTIFDTNMRVARAVGQWDRIQRTKRNRPYLLYVHGTSERPRPQHLAWHGLLLPVDDPFWSYAFPPNGYGCKCSVRSVSKREADALEAEGVTLQEQELDDEGVPTGQLTESRVAVQRTAPVLPLVPYQNKRTGTIELVREGIDPGFGYPPGEGRDRWAEAAEE